MLHDDQGRIYQGKVYSVNPSSGAVSSTALTSNAYFDHRGNLVAMSAPGGLWSKYVYDGAGRLTGAYTTDGGSGTSWEEASSLTDDVVLAQTQLVYDANSNVAQVTDRKGQVTSTQFDALDRPILVTYQDGSTVATSCAPRRTSTARKLPRSVMPPASYRAESTPPVAATW